MGVLESLQGEEDDGLNDQQEYDRYADAAQMREALVELREMRKRYPEVYLAQVVFTRCPDTQKGRNT